MGKVNLKTTGVKSKSRSNIQSVTRMKSILPSTYLCLLLEDESIRERADIGQRKGKQVKRRIEKEEKRGKGKDNSLISPTPC